MRNYFIAISLLLSLHLFAQTPTPESLGLRHLQTIYQNDTVDILIKSKKGDELKPKPVFLFIQGSLPKPLIIVYDTTHAYQVFPFKLDSMLEKYHVAIIGKPYIPLVVNQNELTKTNYVDPATKEFPAAYTKRNYPGYYVQRDKVVIRFLQKQSWVTKNKFVVAGHSEGSTVAAKLASISKEVTQLIYLSGNPFGRILSMIEESRSKETNANMLAENNFTYWERVVDSPNDMNDKGDTHKATYDFSFPSIEYLKRLSIPVLVAYGTKDYCSPYNDLLRVEMMRSKKNNFTFKAYIGLEHNFFPLDKNGMPDYDIYNWDKIGEDIYQWLISQ